MNYEGKGLSEAKLARQIVDELSQVQARTTWIVSTLSKAVGGVQGVFIA